MNITKLTPHPSHKRIYNTPTDIKKDWKDLYSSMEESGLLCPLIVSEDNIIISGVRRWLVAKELNWEEIDVVVYRGDKGEIESLIVTSNSNREKSYAEKINEVIHLLDAIGNRQGRRDLPESEKGSKYEIVARKLGAGFSKENVSKISKIHQYDKNNPNNKEKFIDLVKGGAPVDAVMKLIKGEKDQINDINEVIIREGRYKLINNDCMTTLNEIKDSFIDMCFTSPPYYCQRYYNEVGSGRNPNNIGEENTIDEYVNNIQKISKEVFRVLKPQGSYFLNIGDTIKNGENLAIPELLLVSMLKIGFKLANRIIWKKTNPKPMKLKAGLQPNYEIIFHFVKQNDYKCRQLVWNSHNQVKTIRGVGDRNMNGEKKMKSQMLESPYKQFKTFYDENEYYANIIKSAVATSKKLSDIDKDLDHPAVFPETLPFLPLLQTTNIDDKVLDIFSGSSTMGVVANLFGRKYYGIEFNKLYHKVGSKRMEHIQNMIIPEAYEEMERMVA
jgi:site-specific DNA-methyltransferase (adenine-specific)